MRYSLWRLFGLAAVLFAIVGSAVQDREMSTPAIAGHDAPFIRPTAAPQRELVKARLGKRAATNVCSEWTIPGGYGQPSCYNSQTCLFTSISGYLYEGCGEPSSIYNWITKCWNYGQTGAATVSETVCPSAFPSCGYFAFVFSAGATYSNFGCSTRAYALTIELVDGISSSVVLEGGGTTQTTARPSTIYITPTPNPTMTVTPTQTGTNIIIGTTAVPDIGSHNDKPFPVGAVVGGAVGGLALICFVAFLIWFFFRKRRQDREAKAAQANPATASAYQSQQGPVEIDGKQTQAPYPPPRRIYTPVVVEKHSPMAGVQEYYQPQSQEPYGGNQIPDQPSKTPPFYAQPSPVAHHARHISELSQTRQGPSDASYPHPHGPQTPAAMNEIGESNHGWEAVASTVELPTARTSNPNQQIYEDDKELGGDTRSSYQSPPLNTYEMNVSPGGLTRRPVARQMPMVDMSGAPMSEEYRDI